MNSLLCLFHCKNKFCSNTLCTDPVSYTHLFDKINKRQEPENSGYPAFNHLVLSKGKIIYLAMA